MSFISNAMANAAPLIIGQFIDTCIIEVPVLTNVSGQMKETSTNILVSDIKCAFEPYRLHHETVIELPMSRLMSIAVTHKILIPAAVLTIQIKSEYRIRIYASSNHPELVFEQPVRLDESLSPIIIVGATLRNQ